MAGPAFYTAVLNIAKNEDWAMDFSYMTSATPPVPIPLGVLRMQIRKIEADHNALVALSSPDDGIEIIGAPTAGTFKITISRDKSKRLASGDYVTDLVHENSDGVIERLWEGTATVVDGVTR